MSCIIYIGKLARSLRDTTNEATVPTLPSSSKSGGTARERVALAAAEESTSFRDPESERRSGVPVAMLAARPHYRPTPSLRPAAAAMAPPPREAAADAVSVPVEPLLRGAVTSADTDDDDDDGRCSQVCLSLVRSQFVLFLKLSDCCFVRSELVFYVSVLIFTQIQFLIIYRVTLRFFQKKVKYTCDIDSSAQSWN